MLIRFLTWLVGFAATFALLAPTTSAASWRSCPAFSVTNINGDRVGVAGVRVLGTSCGQARRVARGFYTQQIGSSGAAYAAGYGCAYTNGGNRVRCGSGTDGRGSKKIRWRERRRGARGSRTPAIGLPQRSARHRCDERARLRRETHRVSRASASRAAGRSGPATSCRPACRPARVDH